MSNHEIESMQSALWLRHDECQRRSQLAMDEETKHDPKNGQFTGSGGSSGSVVKNKEKKTLKSGRVFKDNKGKFHWSSQELNTIQGPFESEAEAVAEAKEQGYGVEK